MSKKNGYFYLKKKYVALEEKCAEQQRVIEEQQSTISRLSADIHNIAAKRKNELLAHDVERDQMLLHMGWLRRCFWYLRH